MDTSRAACVIALMRESLRAPIGFNPRRGGSTIHDMRRVPPKSTIEARLTATENGRSTGRSAAPAVVVRCWCGLVERMDRRHLNRFTRDIWARFEERDLHDLRAAILRRRRVLARQARP
jgi:hypothetical protein